MDAMSASEAGSATAAALNERRAEEFEVKRFAGLTGFQSAREVVKCSSGPRRRKKSARRGGRADDAWAVEWYVFVSVFALYALTTAPSVAGGDSGELLAESCSLGTAHPPGYPLFTLLYHIPLTSMPIYFSPALWANLFTAVLGAGASAVVCAITREALRCGGQCGRSITGASAGYLFAFSPLVWQYHCTSEVFALNNLLVALLVHRALLYARLRKIKDLRIASLLTGLALSNQHTAVLFVVPLGARVINSSPITKKETAEVVVLGLYGLTGLSPYAYLPLATPKAGGWGHVRTLGVLCITFCAGTTGRCGCIGTGRVRESLWSASRRGIRLFLSRAALMRCRAGSDGCLLLLTYHRPFPNIVTTRRRKAAAKSAKLRRARVQEYNQQRRAEKGTKRTVKMAARGCREEPRITIGCLSFYLLAFHALSTYL